MFAVLYQWIQFLIQFILKIDHHLEQIVLTYGSWTYLILFIIVFLETGLVVTPILPGDSLLFTAGAIAGKGLIDVKVIIPLTIIAAILGDTVNYTCGRFFGQKMFDGKYKFFKKEYIDKSQAFYDKHGNKTIILCRFIPIIRTFAPFLAGFGKMSYTSFMTYNVVGAFAWVFIFVGGGYFFGGLPIIRESMTMTMFGIIFISILPLFYEIIKTRYTKKEC